MVKRATQTRRDDKMPGREISATKKFRSVVLYGRSGTGKTTLACTFPKPLLLLDIHDEGTDSISDVKDVTVRELSSFEEFEDMYWWLKEHAGKFKTVVIDTVSQIQSMLLREFSEGKKKKGGDWGSLSRREWGDIAAMMKEWFDNYRDLTREGMNVVFIAQDRVFNVDDDDGDLEGEIQPEVGPQLMPSVAKALNAAVGIIGNTTILIEEVVDKKDRKKEKAKYALRIGPSPSYVTKVRKPKGIMVPRLIYDPDYDKIIELIKGE